MNKKELILFQEDVAKVLAEREKVGDFDTNSQYIRIALKGILNLINHAIDKYPKAQGK